MSARTTSSKQFPSKKFAKVKKCLQSAICPSMIELNERYPEFANDPTFPVWVSKMIKKYHSLFTIDSNSNNNNDDDPPLSNNPTTLDNSSMMNNTKMDKNKMIDSILSKVNQIKAMDHKNGDINAINFIIKTKLLDLYLMSLNSEQLEQFVKNYLPLNH